MFVRENKFLKNEGFKLFKVLARNLFLFFGPLGIASFTIIYFGDVEIAFRDKVIESHIQGGGIMLIAVLAMWIFSTLFFFLIVSVSKRIYHY